MKAILIVIDGMRPDALDAARTPNLWRLMGAGAFTLEGRSVSPSITLPCHASLFLSAPPSAHGIDSNEWRAPSPPRRGLVEALRGAGLRSAFFFNWEQLRDLAPPGALEASLYLDKSKEPDGDLATAELAAGWLARNAVDFAFLYLGYTDTAGHDFGWMSGPYLQALARADAAVGMALDAIPAGTTVVVCSDHGGHGKGHGTELPEDMTIPVIIAGHPGLGAGSRLAGPVGIIDIAPTLSRLFGAEPPEEWQGRDLAAQAPGGDTARS